MCNCIVGLAEGNGDEAWLVDLNSYELWKIYIETVFNYCPLCGCKINKEDL